MTFHFTAPFPLVPGLASSLALLASLSACQSAPQSPAPQTPNAAAPAAMEESQVPSGTVRVLSEDAALLQRPTTATFRGRDVWISIGQLSALFSTGGQPSLPFQALSLPLSGGSLGTQKITLPGPDYYPEGTAASEDGTLYIGSIMQGMIVKVPAGSTEAVPFLPRSGAKRGVIGLTVDAPRQLLWFCDSNPKLEDAKKAGDLVGVQLADAHEVVRHALPKAGDKAPFCNDVIVSPDGGVWFTDSAGGRVFHIPSERALTPNSAEVWAAGPEVGAPPAGGSGANGLEWLDERLIVANVGLGTLVEFDPRSTEATHGAHVIALSDAQTHEPVWLCSPDGVERVPGSKNELVVVENGGCAEKKPRVVHVTLRLD
jgi:sugar lactone lactonase YvrE